MPLTRRSSQVNGVSQNAAGIREPVAFGLHKAAPRFSITPEPLNAKRLEPLETNTGTKADDQIVVGAAQEIDFVIRFQPQSNRAKEAFDSTTWIENPSNVVIPQAGDAASQTGKNRGGSVESEVDNSAFDGKEQVSGTRGLELRADKGVENAEVRATCRDCAGSVCEALRKHAVKIV